MIKSVICITTAVFFIVINTIILFLKPEFTYAFNDDSDYCLYYQKWIRSVVFMATIIVALFCIYFSVNLYLIIGYTLLTIECVTVIIYALCKYKGITVCGNNIKVQRLFRKDLNITFDDIKSVLYVSNARLVVTTNHGDSFDVSCNSENYHKFYYGLIKRNVVFKTGKIPECDSYVYISKYDMSIRFPEKMFREFYQSPTYLRHSRYLFSARSLENHEHIEGYYKESAKELKEFEEIIKTDLGVNGFKVLDSFKEKIADFDFTIIKAVNKDDAKLSRRAYIYQDINNYFVIYADYLTNNEEEFVEKMTNSIQKMVYADNKYRYAKIEL